MNWLSFGLGLLVGFFLVRDTDPCGAQTRAPVGADFNSGRSPDESRGLSRGQFLLVACLMRFSTRDLAWKRSKQLVVMPLALSL